VSRVDVSIVVPVFNKWPVTDACLRSIESAAASSNLAAEILLGDDASTDETSTAWARYSSARWPVRHLRSESNVGFLRNVNRAAGEARGEYLCLLNNDVIVESGWLDTLVATLEQQPDVGAVGPLFLDRHGRILECGGMAHADGTARQLGHGQPVSDRRYRYLNDVDYVSAACLVTRTELFRALGGFDERYAPAFYEDTDLCLQLAERGMRVLVNPQVHIVHHEGTTHGVAGGLKRYQQINRHKFLDRWSERLAAHHPAPDANEDRVRTWRRQPAIGFYYPRPLTPDMDSGALRLHRLMLELLRRRHHVLLVSPDDEGPRLERLHAAGIETMRAAWGGEQLHLQLLANGPPVAAVFCHSETEERFAKSYYELSPSTVRLLDTVDLAFLREARRAAVALGLREEPRLTPASIGADGLAELAAARRSDMTLVVSSYERDLLIDSFFTPPERVVIVSNIHEPDAELRPFGARDGFVFLAGFAHQPNVDAVVWLARHVWPLIRQRLPGARLDIYGSAMPRAVGALDDPASGVFVRGFARDHRAVLAGARVMLAPLRYGAGVKGKIGEALAVGTPVVTTPVGAEGMDESGVALGVAELPAGLAELAQRMHDDEDEWQRRSTAGLAVLRERFATDANVDRLLAAVAAGRALRDVPSAAGLELRLLWHELGNPGQPQSVAMVLHDMFAGRGGATSLPRRVWRYYRNHGLRAVARRAGDELTARRHAGR
jgi:O-antigen biosynthesis protein